MKAGCRNLEIEALRAFAVLFVILEHINTLLSWRQGNFEQYFDFYGGVDLFFCISGFVITAAFASEMSAAIAAKPRSYWRAAVPFWIRRIFRIWPLSWIVFLVTALLMLHLNDWSDIVLRGMTGDLAAIVLNLQNIHVAACIDSTNPYCGSFFGIYWSLSLEEQFYLVFPFLFLLPRRLVMLGLVGLVVVFALLPRTTLVWMTRLDAIALGVLLALCRQHWLYERLRPTALRSPVMRTATLSCLLLALCIIPAMHIKFFPTVVSGLALVLVFLASYSDGYLMGPSSVRRALVWVGERSFAIYLLHNTVFWLVAALYRGAFPGSPAGPSETIPFLLAATILLGVSADISFRCIETPLRRLGKRLATAVGTHRRRRRQPGKPAEPSITGTELPVRPISARAANRDIAARA
ncbi:MULTISPECIES: acyltransferase [unclassified Bradyrhizobium]|uniref:acyltransferase family protein n=1 Tax=unclassified Bradyrhizobium TaxID=2631580 RepID=UPI001CD1EC57|nr:MULTISPECIES: acyltransferase [unclassified Bradyrhizobium]MCA1379055.1 acyltransferase [Bradyrhizobium sp. IC4060]MCA1489152.1 acyltransferase [Bradyrhizobium sp. IC4061]